MISPVKRATIKFCHEGVKEFVTTKWNIPEKLFTSVSPIFYEQLKSILQTVKDSYYMEVIIDYSEKQTIGGKSVQLIFEDTLLTDQEINLITKLLLNDCYTSFWSQYSNCNLH